MTDTHVLRIPRTDEDGTFILVQVSSAGSKDLDVKLVATEGLAPYKVKCAYYVNVVHLTCELSRSHAPSRPPSPMMIPSKWTFLPDEPVLMHVTYPLASED